MNFSKKYTIIFVLISIIFVSLYFSVKKYENYENQQTIVSNLTRSSGFFSVLFFMLNHYIYSKYNNYNFKLNSDGWTYKSKDGWTDYFENIDMSSKDANVKNLAIHAYSYPTVIEEYTIMDYKKIIPEVYRYNANTKNEIYKKKTHLQLHDKQYDSIYIRRGDKIAETQFHDEKMYIELLLKKNPNSKVIFIQTDDYNSYLNLQKYIQDKKLNVTLLTLCDPNNKGASYDLVNSMNSEEIYKHTIDFIIDIDILINSNICVCDYSSNVARFIKLAHNNSNNVYDIINQETDIDYQKKICPSHSF